MKEITTIDELAATMFEVHRLARPLGTPEFCASMVSCAVTLAARDGCDDQTIFKLILESAKSSLTVVRAAEELQRRGVMGEPGSVQ